MLTDWDAEGMTLRGMGAGDVAFVYSTWLQSYQRRFRKLPDRKYFKAQRERVDRIVQATRIACLPGAESTIHGYVCGGPGLLHYVYVPFELRQQGLARWMVARVCGEKLTMTHFWPWARLPAGWSRRSDIPWEQKLHLEAA